VLYQLSYDPSCCEDAGRGERRYRVSLCGVWRPHHRQNFRSSMRSGVFRLLFVLW
jgi:hypothetical protein